MIVYSNVKFSVDIDIGNLRAFVPICDYFIRAVK
jgi:hypothetical protein